MVEVRYLGRSQARECFMGVDLQLSDFFMSVLTSKEGEKKQLWKLTLSENKAEKLILGTDPFLVPCSLLAKMPDGYLVQENVTLLRLKLGKGDVPVLLPGVDNNYSLLSNDKVLNLIIVNLKKRVRRLGTYVDQKRKILYVVNEVSLTLNELVKNWDVCTDIFKGYFPLVVPYEKSRETGFMMTIDERCISPKETFNDVHLSDLASFVMNILYSK